MCVFSLVFWNQIPLDSHPLGCPRSGSRKQNSTRIVEENYQMIVS